MLTVVVIMLAYNNYSILLMDNYTDDALTDALLAAGTVNVGEYGNQYQVILSDTLSVNRQGNQAIQQNDKQKAVTDAYNTQSNVLKDYLTDTSGNIQWSYPEYILQTNLQGAYNKYGDNKFKIVQNYGVDHQQIDSDGRALKLQSQNQNINKIQYSVFNDANGGSFQESWITSAELDEAFRQFIQNLSSQSSQLGANLQQADNKELAKAYDNFLTTFGWDFGLSEVSGTDTSKMTYQNFKYSGGKLGDLTIINDTNGNWRSPIYIDYITVFNVYKHYITVYDKGMVYYPEKQESGNIYIRVGDDFYKLNSQDQSVNQLYDICKENGLCGTPIYDKMIITKQTIQRKDADGTTQKVFNNLSENHHSTGTNVIIQSVDFLDPQIFIFDDINKTAIIEQTFSGYLNQLNQQAINVYNTDAGTDRRPQIGIVKIQQNYPYQSQIQYIESLSARQYPNNNVLTYQITQQPNRGYNGSLTHNKQNIVIFNQAVMAQVEFDVQAVNPDKKVTGADNNIRTAFYQRIVDITIQPNATLGLE